MPRPTRIAILEALRDGELTAGILLSRLQIEQANLSQHLAVLRAKQVVVGRSGSRAGLGAGQACLSKGSDREVSYEA